MSKFKDKYRIESSRLQTWDYSNPGWYYVTINTKHHREYFGEISGSKMLLNKLGEICKNIWEQIPTHFKFVEEDYYVIMPNHLHGILILNHQTPDNQSGKVYNLGNIIGSFKSVASREIRKAGISEFEWQERYYDRIIRSEKELFHIRQYIEQNPLRWEIDREDDNIFEL